MPAILGVDLTAMREQICVLFDNIAELTKVSRYADYSGNNDSPDAEAFLGPVLRSPTDEQLGYNAYTATWRINVRLSNPGATAKQDAQALYELLVMRVHEQFDPLDLISAIPIIVDCSYEGADMPTNPLSDGTYYAVFTLSTTFLARQPS